MKNLTFTKSTRVVLHTDEYEKAGLDILDIKWAIKELNDNKEFDYIFDIHETPIDWDSSYHYIEFWIDESSDEYIQSIISEIQQKLDNILNDPDIIKYK